jgi:hypothetical protein
LVYAVCLGLELEQAGISLPQQVAIPVFYKGAQKTVGPLRRNRNSTSVGSTASEIDRRCTQMHADKASSRRASAVEILPSFGGTVRAGSKNAISTIAVRAQHAGWLRAGMEEEYTDSLVPRPKPPHAVPSSPD